MRRLCRLAGVVLLAAGSALALADDKQPAASNGAKPALNLDPPPIELVFTPQQIQDLTADHDDDAPMEDVTIKKPVYETPIPLGTFRALPWALMHPLQAWKILMPITDDD
ncbi:MAG: hypothetical protein WBE92_17270 [Steroidobacteraceae bacterium]